MTLIVRTDAHAQPEKAYALRLLLTEVLGLACRIEWTTEAEAGYTITWADSLAQLYIEDHFFARWPDGGYLRPEALPTEVATVASPFDSTPLTVFFADVACFSSVEMSHWELRSPDRGLLRMDVVAAAFLMATRWEEQVVPDRDRWGRFPAAASLAERYGFLDRPVVHEWAELIWQALLRLGYPPQVRPRRVAKTILSCDIDHPRLWWHSWERLRTVAGELTRPDGLRGVRYWLSGPIWRKRDPFDTIDAIMELGQGQHFNVLGKRPTHYDCWYDLEHPAVQQLLKRIAAHAGGHTIGFHPSREAHTDSAQFASELASLRACSPMPVTTGRYHYLMFEAPHTWRTWAKHDLKEDSTLGYSEREGFRAGLCVPYQVFDTEARQPLPVREQPLVAMDVTLAQYRQYTPDMALERLRILKAHTVRWGGDFTLLWHNSSLHTPQWQGYIPVLYGMLSQDNL
jgi:hypothetical protein